MDKKLINSVIFSEYLADIPIMHIIKVICEIERIKENERIDENSQS